MKSGFTWFLFCILLSACHPDKGTIDIEGKVVDEYTSAPIAHMVIMVHKWVKRDDKDIPVYIGQFFTNDSGFFHYSLKKQKGIYVYDFSVVGDSAYSYSNISLGLTELKKYGKFLDFRLKKLTDLTIAINSKSRFRMDEDVYISWKSDGIDEEFLYPYTVKNHGFNIIPTRLRLEGGANRSEIRTRVFANKETIVHLEIYRYGKHREVEDTIFCKRDIDNAITIYY